MAKDRVSISFTEEQIQRVLAAIVILETELAPLISIPYAERRNMAKMGDKSEVFVRDTLKVLLDNPKLVSEGMGVPEAVADLKALEQKGESTELGLGADLMAAMLEGYAMLKVSGKHHGLEGKRKELSARFARASRKAAEPATA